jgi:pimeloyl-ACP methyl ester carboxylesterase
VHQWGRQTRAGFRLLVLASFLPACSLVHAHPVVSPSALRHVGCPGDVEVELVIPHACFTLEVPVDRSHPQRGDVAVFVVRLSPTGPPSPDPVLVLGSNVGDSSTYGGYAPGPNRTHRIFYVMDPRGTGHSTPSLACAETRRLGATTPRLDERFALAVRSCRDRLRRAGIEPGDYGEKAVAMDARALRHALGVARWNLLTFGTASHYAIEVARSDPGSTRTLVLDSPDHVSAAGMVSARARLAAAWRSLTSTCRAQPECHRRYPTMGALWTRAATALAAEPQTRTRSGTRLRLDPPGLARLVRSYLEGPGPTAPGQLPALLRAVLHGRLPDAAARRLSTDRDVCLGYRSECGEHESALGVYLTVMCRDPAVSNPMPSPATLPLGVSIFDTDNPYRSACRAWGVAPAVPPAAQILPNVPTLALVGALDPFSSAADANGLVSGRPQFLVTFPGSTHNTLGFSDCPISLRNVWLDQPRRAPVNTCNFRPPPLPFADGAS